MKKLLFVTIFVIFATFNINDAMNKQSILNENINNDKTMYNYVGFINKKKETNNSKIKEFLIENNIKTMQVKSSENQTIKKVYFPNSKDNDYLHLNKDKDLKKSYIYSTKCNNSVDECEIINYSIEDIEYHYLFDYFEKELSGNFFFELNENNLEGLKKNLSENGYEIKIEKNVGYIGSSNIDYFDKINIIDLIKENLISIIIFVFMTNYLVAKKSKKIGIENLLGVKKYQILIKIIKDFVVILGLTYLITQMITFLILAGLNKSAFFNIRASLILFITLNITALIVLIPNGTIALNRNIKGLIKNGYKSSKFFVFFSAIIQILLITISSLSIAQIIRLESYRDVLNNIYDTKEIEKYSKNKNVVPFTFDQYEIFKDSIGMSDTDKNAINSFLGDITYAYSSSLYNLNNINFGEVNEINITEVLVDVNNAFLQMNNFNKGCEECILIGNNRKQDFEKNKEIFKIILKERYPNKNLDDLVKYYDDSQDIELLSMSLRDDSTTEKFYKSPIFIVKPNVQVIENNFLKKNVFDTSGVPNMYFLNCKELCQDGSPADALINKIIEYNVGTKIERYKDIMYDYKQEKIAADYFIFKTILDVSKAVMFAILAITMSIAIIVETIRRKIGIAFVLGNRPIEILKDYLIGIFILFTLSFVGSRMLNEVFFKLEFIFFDDRQIIISILILLFMYLGVFYISLAKEFKDKKMSIRLKGDM